MDRNERSDAARDIGILSVSLSIFSPLSVVASLSILGTTVEVETRGGTFLGGYGRLCVSVNSSTYFFRGFSILSAIERVGIHFFRNPPYIGMSPVSMWSPRGSFINRSNNIRHSRFKRWSFNPALIL